MTSMQTVSDFRGQLAKLRHKPCWNVVAGPGTGSHVALDFGRRVPRRRPLRNPCLSTDQQMYQGEYSLLVTCAWRLQGRKRVICSSTSSNHEAGPMQTALKRLIGTRVHGISLHGPALDMKISFDGGLALLVFCDQANEKEAEDNYSFFSPSAVYTVPPGSATIRSESRTKPLLK